MGALEADAERLRVAIDAVVPADDFPSASEAGGLRFWSLITGSERPDWTDRVIAVLALLDRRSGALFARLDVDAGSAVLDGLVEDPDFVWFAQLVNAGFYADPGNGGNDDAVSWRMLGWSPAPAGGWPVGEGLGAGPRPDHPAGPAGRALRRRGGGFGCWRRGGGLGACAVRPVGAAVGAGRLPGRGVPGSRSLAQRTYRQWAGSSDPAFVGGTRVYGAQAWRFMP
jgi:hypothetical protein